MEHKNKESVAVESSSAAISPGQGSMTGARPPAEIYNEKGEQIFTKEYLLAKIAFEKAKKTERAQKDGKAEKAGKAGRPKNTGKNANNPKDKGTAEKRPHDQASDKSHDEAELSEIPNAKRIKAEGNIAEHGPSATPNIKVNQKINHPDGPAIEKGNPASGFSTSRFGALYEEAGGIAASTDGEIPRLKDEIRLLKDQIRFEKAIRLETEKSNRLLRQMVDKAKEGREVAMEAFEEQALAVEWALGRLKKIQDVLIKSVESKSIKEENMEDTPIKEEN